MHYDEFPFDLVEIDKATLSKLSEEDKALQKQYALKFIWLFLLYSNNVNSWYHFDFPIFLTFLNHFP